MGHILLGNKMNELQLQAQCWQWYHNTYHDTLLRRIKNELDNHPRKSRFDSVKQLQENLATGITRGTPDFMFLSTPMIWIEMKIGNGTLSDEQKDFRDTVIPLGHFYFVKWTFESFQELIYEIHQ